MLFINYIWFMFWWHYNKIMMCLWWFIYLMTSAWWWLIFVCVHLLLYLREPVEEVNEQG